MSGLEYSTDINCSDQGTQIDRKEDTHEQISVQGDLHDDGVVGDF